MPLTARIPIDTSVTATWTWQYHNVIFTFFISKIRRDDLDEKSTDILNPYRVSPFLPSYAIFYSAVINLLIPTSLATKEHLPQISKRIKNCNGCLFGFMVNFCGNTTYFHSNNATRAKGVFTAIINQWFGHNHLSHHVLQRESTSYTSSHDVQDVRLLYCTIILEGKHPHQSF